MHWLKIILYIILGAAVFAILGLFFGFLIQLLWNWLMPEIFGFKEIGFWQAIGLFVLARILFGIFGGEHVINPRHREKKKEKRERR